MAYWILQSNPNKYDLLADMAAGTPPSRFSVAAYLDQIQEHDEVAFWVSGVHAGVYALGRVTGGAFSGTGEGDHWLDPAEKAKTRTFVGCEVTVDLTTTPIPKADLADDARFETSLILTMPNRANPIPLTGDAWQAVLDHAPTDDAGRVKSRNPKWAADEIMLALDLYLRRRPSIPGAADPEVVALSELLNALPLHTTRPDQEKFRNPNSVALKLANFMALDDTIAAKGLAAGSRLDRDTWDRWHQRPTALAAIVAAIKAGVEQGVPNLPDPDEDEIEGHEGRLLTRLHRYRERDRTLVKKKKRAVLAAGGKLSCECCGFDFHTAYGDLGEGVIDVHHTRPLADGGPRTTKLSDLALLCANCHRMVHKAQPFLLPSELRRLLGD